jgi:hypothetical protein
MTTPCEQLPAWCRPRSPIPGAPGWALALAPGLAMALLLSACGGSAPASAAATRKVCRQIAGVLADGPDPGADPAGYAEAQILPLRQIQAPDKTLKSAVSQLDAAYQHLFASNGTSSAATRAVAAASKKVNAICPGAAS